MTKSLEDKKQAFLRHYKELNYIHPACKAIGISADRIYEWIEDDKSFKEAKDRIKKENNEAQLAEVEAELYARAMGRKPAKFADTLLIFLAKALDPDKYRDKIPSQTHLVGDIVVKLAVPPYRDQGPQRIGGDTSDPQDIVSNEIKEEDSATEQRGSQRLYEKEEGR